MADKRSEGRRGTFLDWPVGLFLTGVLLAVIAGSNGATGGVLLGLFLAAFGAVTFLARRGTFRPRRD